jgi:hypothetical protein
LSFACFFSFLCLWARRITHGNLRGKTKQAGDLPEKSLLSLPGDHSFCHEARRSVG